MNDKKLCVWCSEPVQPQTQIALKAGDAAHIGCQLKNAGTTTGRVSYGVMEEPWCQTITGREVYPLNLQPEQVTIEDVSHALAMVCRFNGHVLSFYSVAAHSIAVAESMANSGHDPIEVFAGLIHDAHEAYPPGDVASPILRDPRLRPVSEAQQKAAAACEKALGLNAILDLAKRDPAQVRRAVKAHDLLQLACEKRELLAKEPRAWLPLPEPTHAAGMAFGRAYYMQRQAICAEGDLSALGRWFLRDFTARQKEALRYARGES